MSLILPPNQLPSPMPPWARALMQLLPFLPDAQQSVIDYIKELFASDDPEVTRWCRAQMVWEHVGNTDAADRYVNSFDVINITGGEIDSSWTIDDLSAISGGLATMKDAIIDRYSSSTVCKEARLYLMYFNPITPVGDRGPGWKDDPYGPTGPPALIVPYGTAGLSTAPPLPAQVAWTHTEITPYPRHWGRSYWPAPATTAVDDAAHIQSVAAIDLADAVAAGFKYWTDREFFPVVPVTQVDKQPFRGLLTVNQIQVDNVWDVIRRRRAAHTTQRVVRPTP